MSQYLPTGDFKKIKFGCDEDYEYDDLLIDEIGRLHLNTASILCTPILYLVIHGKLV